MKMSMNTDSLATKYFFLASLVLHLVVWASIYSKNLRVVNLNQTDKSSSQSATVLSARVYQKPKKENKADKVVKSAVTDKIKASTVKPKSLQAKAPQKPDEHNNEVKGEPKNVPSNTFRADFSRNAQASDVPDELKLFFQTLSERIQKNKFYPSLSKRLRESGTVVVKFEVHSNGKVQNITVKEQCSFERLNKSAYKVVASLGNLVPLPEKYNKIEITFPLSYVL